MGEKEMIKSGGRFLISIIILIIFNVNVLAIGVGTTGANYLKIDPGVRSAALGSTYVGLAEDSNALYWNPAGIARISYASVDTMQMNWLAGITQQQISGLYPMGDWGVIGGYYSSLTTPYDKETAYDNAGNYYETGKDFNSEIKLVNLTYAKQLNSKLSMGVGLKHIEERLFNVRTNGMALDAGLHYQGFILPDLAVGLVLQNYTLTALRNDEPFPQTIILGAAYTFKLFGSQKLTILGDVNFPNDNNIFYGAGLEYAINHYLAFRIGYKDKVGATLGCGLRLWNLNLNYAYVPYGDLGTTYRVSVGYDFDNRAEIFKKAEKENKVEKTLIINPNENIFEETDEAKENIEELPNVNTEEKINTANVMENEISSGESSPEAKEIVSAEVDDLFEE
ncbi:MAG: PorV/PorQ family protein [Candidatus Margulisbacteria bacterium]|nr:PorV/PorQ family protein [Candidatus Margulisiibacteriota bacterium]